MKNKQAVALATDVLAQLRTRQLVAITGFYFGPAMGSELIQLALAIGSGRPGAQCKVCACGALFLKRLEQGHEGAVANALHAERTRGEWQEEPASGDPCSRDTFLKAALSDAFSMQELSDIESAFEAESGWGDQVDGLPWAKRWLRWDDQERLAAIMLSIVRDGGRFTSRTKLPTNEAVKAALTPPRKVLKAMKSRARARA